MKKSGLYLIAIIGLVAAGLITSTMIKKSASRIELKTQKAGRANMSNTVTATGKLEASVTVKVGTQVSGKIEKLYADFNSIVKKGQLLAQLDTETLESALEASQASLDQATAEYNYQKADYDRYTHLIQKGLIAQRDFDEVEYRYKSALSSLSIAQASYAKSKTNLGYAYIYSPIDGIVLEKKVEEGETVASNFEAPVLFTIANDLTRMDIEAEVDEADIGMVKFWQRVEFTVDAFPDKTFEGRVVEIRLMPEESNNVTTYTVIINAPNPEQILMPGMTANVTFFVTEKKNILVVPNVAFEFTPDLLVWETYQKSNPEMKVAMGNESAYNNSRGIYKVVWLKMQDSIFPQTLIVGETDEINYEVLSGLTEGDEIIISMATPASESLERGKAENKSPFMPTPPGQNKK